MDNNLTESTSSEGMEATSILKDVEPPQSPMLWKWIAWGSVLVAVIIITAYTPMKENSWVVVVDVPEEQFTAPVQQLEKTVFISVGLSLCAMMFVSFLLVRRIMKSIRRLSDTAKEVEEGKPFELSDIEDVISGRDEIAYLGRMFGSMVISLREESEEKFKATIESSPDAITVSDLEGKITLFNQATLKLHGFSESEELIGKEAFELLAPQDRQKAAENMKETLEKGFVKNVRYTLLKKDGSEFPAELSAGVIRDSSGKVTSFIVIAKDITERKEMEKSLIESERHYRTMIENANDMIWMLDTQGNLTNYNRQAEIVSGRKFKDWKGKSFAPLIHPDDLGMVGELSQKTLSGKSQQYVGRIFKKDGAILVLSVHTAPIYKQGKIIGTVSFGRDITELKEAEKALQRAYDELEVRVRERTMDLAGTNEKLKKLDQLKSMFIASMSHELRTPLNSIIGFTGIMLQGLVGELTDEQKKQLGIVKESSNHLLSLINDVIDISKIEVGEVNLNITEFDLSSLLHELADSYEVHAGEKGLEMIIKTPSVLMVKSDRRRVSQVVRNYINNAMKFTSKGQITIMAELKKDLVEILVKDTGIGIKKKDMKKLFIAFSKIEMKGQAVQEGTGLGLYISKKISEVLGGRLSVESEYGKGSTFKFKLPLKYKEVKNGKNINN